jgi:glutaredoxin
VPTYLNPDNGYRDVKNQTLLLAGVFIIVVVAAYLLISNTPSKYDSFAQCLSSSGAKMYGAFWCPHCKDQKAMFGTSFKYATYVECSTPDATAQTQACIDAGITTYPTWEFKNGSRHEGVMTFDELSQATGCQLPS